MELKKTDPDINSLLEKENLRQQGTINLIASENFVSPSVLESTASALTNKYKEALSEDFKVYAKNIVANAKALADELSNRGIKLVTGGTDNHMILINLLPFGIGLGKPAAIALENAGIVSNANTVPYDPSTPFKPSGIRIGTPAVTTRGMKKNEMAKIGNWMASIIEDPDNQELQKNIKQEVDQLCKDFPIQPGLALK
jgi:glycine hydroxymethyltransferase